MVTIGGNTAGAVRPVPRAVCGAELALACMRILRIVLHARSISYGYGRGMFNACPSHDAELAADRAIHLIGLTAGAIGAIAIVFLAGMRADRLGFRPSWSIRLLFWRCSAPRRRTIAGG